MKKNISPFQYGLTTVLVALTCGSASYAYFNHQYQVNKQEVKQTSPSLAKIDSLYHEILNDYVGEVDGQTLIDGALKGMTEAIGDPYSSYLKADDAKDLEDSLSSSLEGIGATLTIVDNKVQIAEDPKEETPAKEAGLLKGDFILKVDGKDVSGLPLDEVVAKVRGKKGSSVTLTIERQTETFDVTLKRASIPIASVTGKMQNDTVGYLSITSFSEDTAGQFKKEIEKLRETGATSFIFDLRQNPGGFLDQVVKMGSMVLKEGQTIVKWDNKKGEANESIASNELDEGFKVTEPITVLVDGGSASAAEIFAGAIKDQDRGQVIGSQTYGKGTMQDVKGIGDEQLKLTTGHWYTPNGTSVNEVGLAPNIEVKYPDYAYVAPLASSLTFKEGDEDENIKTIKIFLQGLGYSFPEITGTFDQALSEAIADFQGKNALEQTGEWTEETAQLVQSQLVTQLTKDDPFVNKALEVLGEEND